MQMFKRKATERGGAAILSIRFIFLERRETRTHSSFSQSPPQVRRLMQQFGGNCTPQEQLRFSSSQKMLGEVCFSDTRQSVVAKRTKRGSGVGDKELNSNKTK